MSFYLFVSQEISVLVELIVGHMRYLLTDVPPLPNSPPDNVFYPDWPAELGLGAKRRGDAPLLTHGRSKTTLKVVIFHLRCLSWLPRPLGSAYPCASVVHMEPFSSSAFKVLI